MSAQAALVALRRVGPFAQLDLRADPTDAALLARLGAAIGVALPVEPNAVGHGAGRAALWLGPDEWVVVAEGEEAAALEGAVRSAAAGAFVAAVDVSENRIVLELAGPRARDVLESGCSIDLHPRAFRPGRCAQTLLARANVVLWQTAADPVPVYRILVRPSFEGYLVRWLEDAMGAVTAEARASDGGAPPAAPREG